MMFMYPPHTESTMRPMQTVFTAALKSALAAERAATKAYEASPTDANKASMLWATRLRRRVSLRRAREASRMVRAS